LPRPLAKLAGWLCQSIYPLAGREPPLTAARVDFMSRDHASQTQRARAELGWQAGTELAAGLRETIAWAHAQNLL
jgi:nucleoside-diphosphate-sugar epimerase